MTGLPAQRTPCQLVAVFAVLIAGHASALAGDPPVPAGRDPGGRAVAFITTGVDYTKPPLAKMLARDGEGEIIGYDFVDDDRRPFGQPGDSDIAEVIIGEGQATTLIPIRADLSATVAAGRAIKYAAETRSRIIAISQPVTIASQANLVSAAASHFSNHLFIVPVSHADSTATIAKAGNLILVTAAGSGGEAAAAIDADIAAPVESGGRDVTPLQPSTAASIAAARIAALAARLQAIEPNLTPAAAKARIVELAKPMAEPSRGPRLISDPRRHFWLE